MKKQIFRLCVGLMAGWFCSLPTANLQAQQLKRQVLGSIGTNHQEVGTTGVYLATTFGQPPNVGTIQANGQDLVLRQGFQQPINNNGCNLMADFLVTPTTLPNNCGSTYQFEYIGNSVPNLEVTWSFGSNASIASFTGLATPDVTFTQAGIETVVLTVNTGNCMASISKMVQVNPAAFEYSVDVTPVKCFGEKGAIVLNAAGSSAPFTYSWNDGNTSASRLELTKGDYAYTISDKNGCQVSDEISIGGADEPLRFEYKVFSALCDSAKDGRIELLPMGGVTPYTVIWDDDNDQLVRDSIKAGVYGVTIIDSIGCEVKLAIKVGELCKDPGLPDVFSPNGDGVNDAFAIPDLDRYPKHDVRIYNRWGNVVFKAEGNFTPWQGQNTNGKDLPAAAYFYVIKLNDPTGIIWNGSITIIR
jgi:gliding motility-associated-like protein